MSQSRWLRRKVAVLILFILWPVIAWVLAKSLIVRKPLAIADAIVVFSGAAAYRERTQLAAQLYRNRTATRLILTNDNQRGPWSTAEQRNPFSYERAIDELEAAGVPREQIEVIPQVVSNTYEEAKVLHDYAKAHGLHTVLVVTSAYHSRRALWTLQQIFKADEAEIGIEPVPTGFQTPSPGTWWLYPSGWQMVLGEYLKIVQYRMRYAGTQGSQQPQITNSTSNNAIAVQSDGAYCSV
jgi:uncharacterized SAM-binding protein YcdF (DUF218 family)